MSDPAKKSHRLESIDYLRGLVMVIMALDHVRDYFHLGHADPLGPDASLILYFTRLITNICAPTFVLLAGVSVGLMSARKSKTELSRFLLSRGIWLIFIEAIVVTFGWKFNLSNNPGVALSVIWAIGVSMVALSILIHLPRALVWGLGLSIVFGQHLLDTLLPTSGFPTETAPWWLTIHRQIICEPFGLSVDIPYPTLAWVGVMACGYGLASVFTWDADRRRTFLLRLGGGLLLLFVGMRWLNVYGDTTPWESGETAMLTLRNFLNVGKYPPSFLFLSFNLGLAFLILPLAERWRPPLSTSLVTIGRVPLFYYVIHIYLIHALAVIAGMIQGFSAQDLCVFFFQKPADYGFNLFVVYLVWLGIVFALYPACRWFARMKATRKDWWMSYL